jgi:hypothetical protein
MSAVDSNTIRFFIGYDSKEAVAWHVLAHSILRHASQPVAITPIALNNLAGVFQRERNPLQSTEFSFSRFLAPWLCGYEGWAIFTDCDMLMRADVAQLWALRDPRYAVQVVQHHHVPKETTKFLDQPQTKYEKKNWTSVMLMNCSECRALTPEYVNRASGLELHQFKWLGDDSRIGALPAKWNHLVDYDPPRADAALVHFTQGGPWFPEYTQVEFADEWFAERDRMNSAAGR